MEPAPSALRTNPTAPFARPTRSTRIAVATTGAVAFALLTTAVGAASGAPPQFLILDLAIGLTYIVTGVIACQRRPEVLTGPLLLLCGVLNFVGSYGPSERPIVTNLGFAFEGYYDVALAVLVLALPGRLPQGAARWVAVAFGGAFLARSLSRLLFFDLPSLFPDCSDCPSNPFAIAPNLAAYETTETLSTLAIGLLALLIAGICLRRLIAARPLARRVLWPILAAGMVAMLVAAFDAFETVYFMTTDTPLLAMSDQESEVWSWSLFAARLLVPIGFLVGSLRLRMAGGPLVALAVGLGRVPSPVRLESALGAALGDPGVRLVRRDPDGDGWLTADGRHTGEPVEDADHAVTMLEHDGRPLAAIEHDPVLREDPALVGSVMAVLRLAVENERLDAALQAQLEEVRASRARLVRAAEDERRRLERDLHDGAQQRLVAVTIALQRARQQAGADGTSLELRDDLAAVAEELQGAIDDLRELARGIHPAILEDDGLPAAVAALGRRAGIPVEISSDLARRPPRHIEATAYFTVAEALTNATRHARATRATVALHDAGERLVVRVEDDGVGGADPARGTGLSGLADRLAAIDGSLAIESPKGGGTIIQAEMPLP